VDECGGGPSDLRSRSGRFGGVGKEGASADFAEEMKDTTGVSPWRLHCRHKISLTITEEFHLVIVERMPCLQNRHHQEKQ
jgi:hypothetical protein